MFQLPHLSSALLHSLSSLLFIDLSVRPRCRSPRSDLSAFPRFPGSCSGRGLSAGRGLEKQCAAPLPILRHVADAMAADMQAGLAVDSGSDLKMILSYVDALPTGKEKGLFYALYLGGTNFREMRVQLGGKDERLIATEFAQVPIPQELMFGTSEVD